MWHLNASTVYDAASAIHVCVETAEHIMTLLYSVAVCAVLNRCRKIISASPSTFGASADVCRENSRFLPAPHFILE